MSAIFKREFQSYLHTVIGWLFMAANLFFVGLYFTAYNLMYGSAYFSNAISAAGFITMISVPILTMNALAQERKNKTDQLILTAPVPIGQIIAGKYLALAAIYTMPLLLVCFYPLVMQAFGDIPMLEAYTAILGFYLYGLTCMAVGLFISSLTENQVIAAVLSFAALFVSYIMSGLCSLISASGNLLTQILGCFDFYSRFGTFLEGTLDLKAVLYFVSVTVFMLFLTCQSVQKRRWSVSVKTLKTGVFSSGMILAAAAVLVFVNLLAGQLPDGRTSLDMTENKLYSLTGDTLAFLDTIKEDITIYVYGTESGMDENIAQTLNKYVSENSHIRLVYKDPVKYPNFTSAYTQDTVTENSLIVTGEKRSKVIPYSDMYEQELDYSTYTSKPTGYDAEGRITSALDYVTSEDTPIIYMTGGHDEKSLDTSFSAAVAKANITMQTLNLMDYEAVPEDADAILILAPASDFSKDDAAKVKTYMEGGGKAIIVTTYTDQDMTNLKSIITEYGATLYDGVVAENSQSNYYQNPFYLIPNVENNEYTSDFSGSKYIFDPYAQGLKLNAEDESLTVTNILTTTESAVSKKDVSNMKSYEAEEGDETGPFVLGAEIEKTKDLVTSKLFLFTSADLFTDTASQMVSGANLQLFTKVISSLVDTQSGISIPVKAYTQSSITVTQNYFVLLGLMTVLVIPVSLLAAGIVIWIRRRRR